MFTLGAMGSTLLLFTFSKLGRHRRHMLSYVTTIPYSCSLMNVGQFGAWWSWRLFILLGEHRSLDIYLQRLCMKPPLTIQSCVRCCCWSTASATRKKRLWPYMVVWFTVAYRSLQCRFSLDVIVGNSVSACQPKNHLQLEGSCSLIRRPGY